MTSALHLLTDFDEQRSRVIEQWSGRFESAATKRTMDSALRAVARCALGYEPDAKVDPRVFPWESLADLVFYEWVQDKVRARVEIATTRKYMSAVRSLLMALARAELTDPETVRRTLQLAYTLHDSPAVPSYLLSEDQMHRLLYVCRADSNRVLGTRDLAMIATAAGTGARRAEIVRLQLESIRRADNTIMFDLVKGGGFRETALHRNVASHLDAWLHLRGETAGPLFVGLRKGGRLQDTHLSAHQFWKILRRRAAEAGIDRAPTPHDLRRWFVSTLLTEGVDLFVVMRAVGHRSPTTTALYDRRPILELRKFVDRLPIPDDRELDDMDEYDEEPPPSHPD